MAKNVLLVEGSWQTVEYWDEAIPEFERRGYTVHAPGLRYHDLPLEEGAKKIGSVSMIDYVHDMVEYAKKLDSPPLIVGHSLGGLYVQLIAARIENVGVIAAAPAPAAGIFPYYLNVIRSFGSYFLQGRPWTKPMMPKWEKYRFAGASLQPEDEARRRFKGLVAESGRVYCEMILPFLDRKKAAKVDYDAIKSPALVIAGEFDNVINPRISRTTADRLKRSKLAVIKGSDHMLFFGAALPEVMAEIDTWVEEENIFKAQI